MNATAARILRYSGYLLIALLHWANGFFIELSHSLYTNTFRQIAREDIMPSLTNFVMPLTNYGVVGGFILAFSFLCFCLLWEHWNYHWALGGAICTSLAGWVVLLVVFAAMALPLVKYSMTSGLSP